MPIRFAVLGDGAWGSTISLLLAQKEEHAVTLWSAREENGQILRERRDNAKLGCVLSNSFGFGGTNASVVLKGLDA